MGVLEDLYHGNLHPAEKILPRTERYADSQKKAATLAEKLKNQLTSDQFNLFEAYCNAKANMAVEMYCESFRQGALLGAELERELHPEDAAKALEDTGNEAI